MDIDTLVMLVGDQNAGKSNQLRTIFEEPELYQVYNGYPQSNNIKRYYQVDPGMELFLRLSSWHEKGEDYQKVKRDIRRNHWDKRRRYKVLVPAQVTATPKLVAGELLFQWIVRDFQVRRAFIVWLSPDRSARHFGGLSTALSQFLSQHREASSLTIDSLALHPSASPAQNAINSRLLCDMLFRA